MSTHRTEILGRIREALRQPTDPHIRADAAGPEGTLRQWLPPGGNDYESQTRLFADLSEKLKTTFVRVPDQEAAAAHVATLAQQEAWQRIAWHDAPLVQGVTQSLAVDKLSTDEGYDPAELEGCDAGITACDALVAQTGSVLLTSRSAGGRALSVLPPHHVVVATQSQMIPDLPAAYALLHERYSNNWPSFMTLITGPSRTGDIERILVLGAHGPKRLTVVLVEES